MIAAKMKKLAGTQFVPAVYNIGDDASAIAEDIRSAGRIFRRVPPVSWSSSLSGLL